MKPILHFSAKKNWINDPNGLIYFKGIYHLFYQYFPYGCTWGTMHWGHAFSKDMVKWENADLALFPSIDADRNGCFSGSAIEINGEMHLIYTGIKYYDTPENNVHIAVVGDENKPFDACQIHIKSIDGFNFDNFNGKSKVIDKIIDKNIGCLHHTRDPKIWYKNGFNYVIVGTKVLENNRYVGKVLVYKGVSLNNLNLVTTSQNNSIGDMWECPDYFELENNSFLIMSPENITLDGDNYTNNSIILEAKYNYEDDVLEISDEWVYLDSGLDLYAPQTFKDEFGERVMIGWIRMPHKHQEGFIGLHTLPRTIYYDGDLKFKVHRNIESQLCLTKDVDLTKEFVKLNTSIKNKENINIGGLQISVINNVLTVNRENIFKTCQQVGSKFSSRLTSDEFTLEIYLDVNVVEIFINDGKDVITLYVDKFENEIKTVDNYVASKYKELAK